MTTRAGGPGVLVGNRLSTWARLWSALMAAQCASVACSIYFRPSPVIGYLPGSRPLWSALFFGLGAVLLGAAAIFPARRRAGMGVLGLTATIHLVYGVGALGYAIFEGMSWILATEMFTIALANALIAVKIAGPKH